MDLDPLFDTRVLAGTRWSVDIRGDTGGEEGAASCYRRGDDVLLKTASVAKIFVLIELAHQIATGVIDPQLVLNRRALAPVADSGLWHLLATDKLPVNDVATLVGSLSDNLATNALIRLIGLEAIQARAGQLAPGGSTLHDIVRDTRTARTPATLSEGCARDWASILVDLHRSANQGAAASASVLGWLAAGADLSMVASAFDLDPLAHACGADHGIRVWNKTGTDEGVRADVGVVERDGHTWTYAVICNWDARRCTRRSAVLGTMREIGSAIVGAR